MKLIAVLTGDVNNQAFVVPKGSAMQSLAELPGKRVGYIRSTSSHYMLLRALKEQGLTLADIQPFALTPQDGFAAFQNGNLDVWVTFGYFIQLAELRSGARVLRTGQGYLSGNYVIAANQRAIDDPGKRAAIEDYVQREYRSWQWVQHNPEAWAAKSEKILGIPARCSSPSTRPRAGPACCRRWTTPPCAPSRPLPTPSSRPVCCRSGWTWRRFGIGASAGAEPVTYPRHPGSVPCTSSQP